MGKSRSLLLAGLAAGAYAYFRKKENRDKAMEAFNSTKEKVNTFMESQKQGDTNVDKAANPNPYYESDNEMVNEGSVTGVNYYNDIQADEYLMNEEIVNEPAQESETKITDK